jgi:hypothetical protein
MPVRWDPQTSRMLEATPFGAYQWRAATPGASSEPAPIMPRDPSRIDSSNGSVLSLTAGGRASYASHSGLVSTVLFGTVDSCAAPPLVAGAPPGSVSFPFVQGSLSRNGDLLAVYCNKDLYAYRIDASGSLAPAGNAAIAPSGGANFANISITAGPADCGVAVAMVSPPSPSSPSPVKSVTILRPDGTRKQLAIPSLPAGNFDVSVPSVAFAGDGRVIIIQGFAPVAAFTCDGAPATAIATPGGSLLHAPEPGRMMPGQLETRWMDDNRVAVASMFTGQLFVIDTNKNSLETFAAGPAADRSLSGPMRPLSQDNIFLPPATAGAPPRAVQIMRKVEARALNDASPSSTGIFLPQGAPNGALLLTGGRYLLSRSYWGTSDRIVDLTDGSSTPVPGGLVTASPTNGVNGWAALKLEGIAGAGGGIFLSANRVRVASVETYSGRDHGVSLPIPAMGDSERSAVVEAIRAVLAKLPNPLPPDPAGSPFFPMSQLKGLTEDPSRLSIFYMPGVTAESLASSGTTGAQPLCPMLFGKTTAGAMIMIPIQPPPGTLRPLIVSYVNGSPSLTAASADCNMSNFVIDGDKPALVTLVRNGTQAKLKWTRGGAVIDGGDQPGTGVIAEGTALDDGSLLLLLTNAPANNANHMLIRLLPGGGQALACPQCNSIAVGAAAEALTSKLYDQATGRGQVGIPIVHYDGIVRVDRAGKVLARPEGDETVIQSLVTGKELIRFRLGRVLVLRSDLAIVDTGEANLQVHRF